MFVAIMLSRKYFTCMKRGWGKVISYSREFSFVFRNSADWSTRIRLLKNTALFHLNNACGDYSKGKVPFVAQLHLGAYRDIRLTLRPLSGDIFVLFEVLMGKPYAIPDTMLPPDGVRVILDCG